MDRYESGRSIGDVGDAHEALNDDDIISVGDPLPRVTHVEVTDPRTFFARFDDGVKGHVRFEESALKGVFAKLRDPDYFARVGISYGAVSWPNEGPDLGPCSMHHHFRRSGEWVLK